MRLKFRIAKISAFLFAFILVNTALIFAEKTTVPVVKNFNVDKRNKCFVYELTKPAVVRIRVGSRSGPVYRTLVNWQEQDKGKHIIKWDGMDSSGTFNILDNRNFTFSFNYYLPGKNEEANTMEYLGSDLVISDNFIGRVPRLLHLSQIHKNHKKEQCRDLDVVFEKDCPYVIKGICAITIKVPDKDKIWFNQERFSINIFIDDIFVKGEALGYFPYTWNFNSKGINKGRHLITVNIKGFNDHMAVGSLPVYVEPVK